MKQSEKFYDIQEAQVNDFIKNFMYKDDIQIVLLIVNIVGLYYYERKM